MFRTLLTATCLLLALAPAPSPARADAGLPAAPAPRGPRGSVVLEAPPARVRAGDEVTLRWTVRGEVPEELELLLSVDDGRTFALRVSPQLDGHERTYRWRVPDVAAGMARLRARMGNEHGEVDGPASAAFRIEPSADGAPHGGLAVRVGGPRQGARRHGHGVAHDEAGERETAPTSTVPPPVHEAGWWSGLARPATGEAAGWSGARTPALSRGEAPPALGDERRDPRGPLAADRSIRGVLAPATPARAPRAGLAPPDARPLRVPLRN